MLFKIIFKLFEINFAQICFRIHYLNLHLSYFIKNKSKERNLQFINLF